MMAYYLIDVQPGLDCMLFLSRCEKRTSIHVLLVIYLGRVWTCQGYPCQISNEPSSMSFHFPFPPPPPPCFFSFLNGSQSCLRAILRLEDPSSAFVTGAWFFLSCLLESYHGSSSRVSQRVRFHVGYSSKQDESEDNSQIDQIHISNSKTISC